MSFSSLLTDPNPDDPLVPSIAKQLTSNRGTLIILISLMILNYLSLYPFPYIPIPQHSYIHIPQHSCIPIPPYSYSPIPLPLTATTLPSYLLSVLFSTLTALHDKTAKEWTRRYASLE